MKRFKKIYSWFMQIGLSVVVVAFLCISPFSILPSLLKAESEVNKSENYDYQGILELWHVETFEGGSVSRSNFLEKEAINFESLHKGTYIVIQTMSLEQLLLNLEAGKRPNMLSFGIGVGDSFLGELIALDSENVRSDISKGGIMNSKQYAVPYILGGYALISNGQSKIGIGLKGQTNPLKALQKNDISVTQIFGDLSLDSYNAYDKFIKGNFDSLVGTQRDVYRCYSRQQKGSMTDLQFSFLGGYTDLVQYISIFKSSQIEQELCKSFVSKLISSETQSKLANYNLFSVLSDVTLYNGGIYCEFESVLKQSIDVENVFLGTEQINIQKQEAYKNVVR